ncbi:CCCH zinc finger and RRM domain-containing protein [Colletotrichum truncatum]|uniref:CCCH zinc finger and RRM domain-containing protein n=1 Tax=Colletotrichum truncatum TaxID=5467 RepID=A0ACC3YMH5_COLTU|nr:CCCH zinc finger and RRM domain-containing protein [Colletotrichum truncatum]KAF6792243.1 CCCH zinc finger and RRM domain-containing protein [Colletotrichum truncatum]
MFFPSEDAPLLKAWLMKKLPEVSDTETDILADYVLALLASQEGDAAPIRAACESELPQFLNIGTAPEFVDELFRVIEHRSYVPGAPPPPKKRPDPAGESRYGGSTVPIAPSGTSPQIGSRKRSYHESGDAGFSTDRDHGFGNERAYKQPRRGQWDAKMTNSNDYPSQPFVNTGFQQLPPGVAPYDPNFPQPPNGPQDWRSGPSIVPTYNHGPSYGPPQGPRKTRQRCRDFATKGYCARGNSCQYDHGSEPIWLPSSGSNRPPNFEDFDPRDAAIMMSQNFAAMQQLMEAFSAERGGRGVRKGRQGIKGRRRPNRSSFSADGPVNDKTKTAIVVENIPEEHFSEEAVRNFFSEFGTIENISLQPHRRLAIVKYDSWKAANAAYRSPKVIFDNRFVRVFWHVEEHERSTVAAGANGADLESGEEAPAEPEFDMDEFLQKQEEAQKLHEEKLQKKQELDKQRQELEQRQRELLARHREEQRKLQAKLGGSKNGGVDDSEGEPGTLNSALRAQLAALEDEAKLLGLDPNILDEPSPWYASVRGRGRGRGGFNPRGRGFAPRGRGSHRGGYMGDVHEAYAAYSLDNRPKTVSVTGIDFTSPEKDEALRQYLLGVGEFTNIHTLPSNTQITFRDRKTAEKFFYGLSNQEIPGIDGQVEMSWVAQPAQPVKLSTENGTSKRESALDQDVAIGNAAPNGSSAITLDQQPEQQPEMDYDVADDDNWGVE